MPSAASKIQSGASPRKGDRAKHSPRERRRIPRLTKGCGAPGPVRETRAKVPVKWALAAAIEKPLRPAGPGRARLRIGTRSAQGNPFDRPHRVRGQRGVSDPVSGSAARAKRISAESECEPVFFMTTARWFSTVPG
jgi:hypothetical protein